MLARVDGKSPADYLTRAGRDACARSPHARPGRRPPALDKLWGSG